MRKKLLLIVGFFVFFSAVSANDFSYLQKKHKAGMESWILCSKLNVSDARSTGLMVLFFSGKWLFISGNAVITTSLDIPAKKFKSDYKLVVPPFHKVSHNYSTLNENFSGNVLRYDSQGKYYFLETVLPEFKNKIKFYPQRKIIPYGKDTRYSGGYCAPGLKVKAEIEGIQVYGDGYYEHFWADAMEEDHDWLVINTDSGHSFRIMYRHNKEDWNKQLPGSFIIISKPDDSSEKIADFNLEYINWWSSGRTKRKYPVSAKIKIPSRNMELLVTSGKEDQEVSSMGMNFWMGFCEVTAKIENERTSGWAFMMPMGYER